MAIKADFSSNAMTRTSILLIMMVLGLNYGSYATDGACMGDVQGMIMKCTVYVQKGTPTVDPSATCCDAVKTVDIPCICNRITKDIEVLVDMNKVFHVASSCGRPLAHGTKCGSSIVP